MNRQPFGLGEWYHCYNRGVDKRCVFTHTDEYKRFMRLLYLANDSGTLRSDNISKYIADEIFKFPRSSPLVSIGAYCLMPNHIHLLLHEIVEGGITAFTRKIGTAYAMYFNIKYERTGNLFMKPIRSSHIGDDHYLQTVVNYIHANPAEFYEPGWKLGKVRDMPGLQQKLLAYPYSSFQDHQDTMRPTRTILGEEIFELLPQTGPQRMLSEAAAYYREIADSRFLA